MIVASALTSAGERQRTEVRAFPDGRPDIGDHHTRHVDEVGPDAVFVPDDRVPGDIGSGWHQVTAELAHERSGPDRCLVPGTLLALVRGHGPTFDDAQRAAVGRACDELRAIRPLPPAAVARALDRRGAPPVPLLDVAAARTVGSEDAGAIAAAASRVTGAIGASRSTRSAGRPAGCGPGARSTAVTGGAAPARPRARRRGRRRAVAVAGRGAPAAAADT